ncbi:uncharacterized protein PAC_04464 [Phialocephala subalpina]|uniref:Uncharacterized protein n=1 Tax=Phialocephala subalpina TaxID=576137 RepID=A0A1L7WP84_9HELO|nr:uncharacterized protein PAC_04464 [Phialocephala subalpina]
MNTPTPCPTCASRPFYPPLPLLGTTYGPFGLPPIPQLLQPLQPFPQPQLFYPPGLPHNIINLPYPTTPRLTAPQITPGPGSYGTPLPVPANTPQSPRWEFVGGRLTPVTHYAPASNGLPTVVFGAGGQVGLRAGHNPLYGYDFGGLPPGWSPQVAGWMPPIIPMQGAVPMQVPGMTFPMSFVPVVNQPAPTAAPAQAATRNAPTNPARPANPTPATAAPPQPAPNQPAQPAQPAQTPQPSQAATISPIIHSPDPSQTSTQAPSSKRPNRRVAFDLPFSTTSLESPPPSTTSASGSSTLIGLQSSAADAAGSAAAGRAESGDGFIIVN